EQLRYLNFGRVVDTTKLKAEFGFTPRWSTVAAFDDYISGRKERRGGGQTVGRHTSNTLTVVKGK
ncbi:MAG: hypothetical protein ACRDQ5_22300, partial [Sciscionella sp.]